MSYEEFLDLPVNYITEMARIIRMKRESNIPFSQDDIEFREHFIRYTQELQLKEDRMRLEYCWSLNLQDER